jgi:glycosyltransferase involved in cell wall biosynthesis
LTVDSLRAAFKSLGELDLDPSLAVKNAERFGPDAFRRKLRAETEAAVESTRAAGPRRRVLSVIPGPTFGGAANQVVKLREPLAAHGFDVIAAVPSGVGNVAPRLEGCGVPTVRLPMRRLRATSNPFTHARLLADIPLQIARLRRVIRDLDIDIVQNHGDLNPYAAVAGRLERRAVVWQLLDSRTPASLRPVTSVMIRRVADVVLVVGEALSDAYPRITQAGRRKVITPPPVDTSRIHPDVLSQQSARAELGVSPEAVLIGTIGNRNPQKAQDALVRAVAAIRRRVPSVDLRILGGASPDHPDYEADLQRVVRQAGLSPTTVVDPSARATELVHAFDIMAMTSAPYSEGMPTVLLEAMAAGVPCVSTDVGSVCEVIEHGRTGLVVSPNSDVAMADALLQLVEQPDLRRRMGAAGRSVAVCRFDVEACAERYVAGYREALAHRSLVDAPSIRSGPPAESGSCSGAGQSGVSPNLSRAADARLPRR